MVQIKLSILLVVLAIALVFVIYGLIPEKTTLRVKNILLSYLFNNKISKIMNLKNWFMMVGTIVFLLIGGVGSCMYVMPKYSVWQQDMTGRAEYARAEQNRKIKIEEAKANLEAEKLNAQAEIERAKGAAEAIKIENGSLTPTYIQYLWVRQQNANSNNRIIYIPTEAGLPILEAGRDK